MDKIARIRQEIERLKGICTTQIKANPGQTFPFVMEMTGYDKLLSFLDSLESEKPVPADLDEAAIDFADGARKQLFTKDYAISSIADYDHGCIDGFIAGAKWQKEQMMKEAVEGEISAVILRENRDEVHYAVTYPEGKSPHSITDKVKLIIVKE